MLYKSTVLLIQGSTNVASVYTTPIKDALDMTMTDGNMDVYLMKSPATLLATEQMVRRIYEVCRQQAQQINREGVAVTVLLDGKDFDASRDQTWEVVVTGDRESANAGTLRDLVPEYSDVSKLPVMLVKMDDGDYESETHTPSEISSVNMGSDSAEHHQLLYTTQCEQNVVIVGGTFDHLHDGHKLLLTMAGYLARARFIVGLTSAKLLERKRYAEAMQPYEYREQCVKEFMNYVFPPLQVDCYPIEDVYGPTATIKEIDALIVSRETRSGGVAVNEKRKELGWPLLQVYEVDLIGSGDSSSSGDKLSSTELRRLELEKLSLDNDK